MKRDPRLDDGGDLTGAYGVVWSVVFAIVCWCAFVVIVYVW